MINGFTHDDITYINRLANKLRYHIGKRNSITSASIYKWMKDRYMQVSPNDVKRYISYLRTTGRVGIICQGKKGYYVSANKTEAIEFIKTIQVEILDIRDALEKSCKSYYDLFGNLKPFRRGIPLDGTYIVSIGFKLLSGHDNLTYSIFIKPCGLPEYELIIKKSKRPEIPSEFGIEINGVIIKVVYTQEQLNETIEPMFNLM